MKFTSTSNLIPGMVLGQNLFGIEQYEKYKLGTILTANDILFLDDAGVVGVYTMEALPAKILSSDDLMKQCLEAVKKADINAMLSLAKQIVTDLTARPISLDFRSVRSYKDYLSHHSVCVAVYAVATGIKLGLSKSELEALALAGLLHDIGQALLNKSLLLKKEQLTPDEYEQVKRHPKESYNFVAQDDRIPAMVKDAILAHHENYNGTGYPNQLSEDNIPMLARILHVVDVYDALMAKRPYKKGMSSAQAINYLIGGKTILFDELIVDTFAQIAVPYPTGCEVKLSTNEIALVISQTEDKLRPRIYLNDKCCVLNLFLEYPDITILYDVEYEHIVKESVARTELETASTQTVTTTKKILIVDDVFVSIAHTKRALGPNYDVVTCSQGSKAAMMVSIEKPDLILMDYEMPDMDGATAVNEIHKLGYRMPIIFLTGKSNKETVYACKNCGAIDYILKPANPVYLRTRIEMALNNIDGNALL